MQGKFPPLRISSRKVRKRMEKSEFIKRTGFEPMDEEYRKIEELYYQFNGDKDSFCKCFVENGGILDFYNARADTIQELEDKLRELAEQSEHMETVLNQEIKKLKDELDQELEWKPCSGGTNMDQEKYVDLLTAGGTEVLTEEAAKEVIYHEYGFDPNKISIVSSVSIYEANRHHRMRVSKQFDRKAVYNATDWNYIRFDCASWMYEMINGELRSYVC